MVELASESNYPLKGEGAFASDEPIVFHPTGIIIKDKKLSFEEASSCLCHLGKDESGIRYAYLMIDAQNRKLTDVSSILNFKHVLFLDLSGNYLTLDALQVLVEMPFLIFLKAEKNRVDSAALGYMPYLQVLCLNKNQITETCDINQPMLDCLELQYNLICTAQFDVERLRELKQLELRGNHLMDIKGVYPENIDKLYLAENKISTIVPEDLGKLKNIKILHLRDNIIRKLKGFTSELENLKYLNLRNNKINKMRQFRRLQCLKCLETLIVKGNPVYPDDPIPPEDQKDDANEEAGEEGSFKEFSIDPRRIALLVLLPSLKRINKQFVSELERQLAMEVREEKYKEIMEEESSEDETEMPSTTDATTEYLTTDTEHLEEEDEEDEEDEEEDNEGDEDDEDLRW